MDSSFFFLRKKRMKMERVESVEGVEGIFFEGNLRIGKQFDPPLPSILHCSLPYMPSCPAHMLRTSSTYHHRRQLALAAAALPQVRLALRPAAQPLSLQPC